MNKKRNNILIISMFITLLLITIASSFAYFTANITGQETGTTITTTDGTMNINYSGGANITFAGGAFDQINQSYYLYKNASGSWWWSSSPDSFGPTHSLVFNLYSNGHFSHYSVIFNGALRPSIALKSNTKIIGSGTSSSRFKVI